MNFNRRRQIPALTALMMTALPALAGEPPQLRMTQPADADGAALPRPVIGTAAPQVTTLPFHVALAYRCPAATDRPLVFVSIADSWRSIDVGEMPSPLIVRVDVPTRQLQWLGQPDAECRNVEGKRRPDELGAAGMRYYRLHAGTTGYAMLTCTEKDGRQSAATTAAPLDVWLACPAPSTPE